MPTTKGSVVRIPSLATGFVDYKTIAIGSQSKIRKYTRVRLRFIYVFSCELDDPVVLPIARIVQRFIPGYLRIENSNCLVVNPLPRKLC